MNAEEPRSEGREPRQAPATTGLGDDFIMALRFFSRLPTGDSAHEKPDLGRIALALPFASLVIGLGPALLLVGGSFVGLPAYFAAALAVAGAILVCGAMAEDAIADAADGLFGGHTRERRLEIMKDSRHGTYGVAALCLFILLRVTALGSVGATHPLKAGLIWLAASVVARSGALWLATALPPARTDGASASAGDLPMRNFAFGMIVAVLAFGILGGPATSYVGLAFAAAIAVVVVALWAALCRKLVGGQTGDLIGALVALLEIGILTGLLLFV